MKNSKLRSVNGFFSVKKVIEKKRVFFLLLCCFCVGLFLLISFLCVSVYKFFCYNFLMSTIFPFDFERWNSFQFKFTSSSSFWLHFHSNLIKKNLKNSFLSPNELFTVLIVVKTRSTNKTQSRKRLFVWSFVRKRKTSRSGIIKVIYFGQPSKATKYQAEKIVQS